MTAIKQIEDALKVISASSVIIGLLPEHPSYNGSVLLIDDDEAERIWTDLDCVIDNLYKVMAHIAAQDAENAQLREQNTELDAACAAQDAEIARLREGLKSIAEWRLPVVFDKTGRAVRYELEYGSNGARDYIRAIASKTLQ